jgi:hypothetical protein
MKKINKKISIDENYENNNKITKTFSYDNYIKTTNK